MHTWIVSTFWLLWIMPLWIWVYRYLFETLLSILGWYMPRSWIGGSYGNYIFHRGGNHHTLFFSSCTALPPHQQCTRFISSLLPCQYLLPWVVFFNSSHPSGYEVVSQCGFDLYLPYDYCCWTPFHVLTGHLCIFAEMSVQVLCPFFNCCSYYISGKSSLYILDTIQVSDKWSANIFFHKMKF